MRRARPGRRRPRQDDAGAEVPRRAVDVDARLDLHPDHRRRLAGGRRAVPERPRRPRHASSSRISRRSPSCRGRSDPTAQVIHDAYHADGRPVEIAPRQVLRRIVELYAQPRLGAGGGAGDRVLSRQAEQGPGLSARAAGRPLGPAGVGAPVLFDRRGQRVRRPVRRHLPLLRSAGPRDRHADPRGRRGADGDQPPPRRSAGARRPGVPVQAHDPRGGAPPRHVCDLHGQADVERAGLGDAHPPVGDRHRRPARNIFSDDERRPDAASSSPSSAARRNTCRR